MAIIGISGKIGSGKDTVGKIVQYLSRQSKTALDSNWNVVVHWCKEYLNNERTIMVQSWEIKKFAYKLKQVCSLLTSIPVEDFEKQEVKDSFLPSEWDKIMYPFRFEFKNNNEINDKLKDPNICYDMSTPTPIGKDTYVVYLHYKIKKMTVRELLQNVGTEAMRNHVHENVWVNALFADYKWDKWTDKADESQPLYPNWVITDLRFPNELKAIKDRDGITIRVTRVLFTEDKKYIIGIDPIDEHPSETALDNARFDYVIYNNDTIEELIEKLKEILIKEKII